MIPLRLVVDTNIVVSAALKPEGLQRTVLLLAITKPARLYVSAAIFAEYREVLSRCPGGLSRDWEYAAFSEVLEEDQGHHVTRVR